MSATDVLKRDHKLLRKQLEFLESAIRVAPEAQFALREMCFLLSVMLKEHMVREEEVLRPYRKRMYELHQYRLGRHYETQWATLRKVNELLLKGLQAPVERAVEWLHQLVRDLQVQMSEEEHEVFPLVDRFEEEQAAAGRLFGEISDINGEMTVNHVLRIHPLARTIFQAFHINCDVEGCHCLDELRWRNGVDVDTLLLTLRASWN